MQKAATCLLPSDLLLFKCRICVHGRVCVRACALLCPNQLSSRPLNLKCRLWLLSELIYMPLMSPPRCAFCPEAERTSLFSKFRET